MLEASHTAKSGCCTLHAFSEGSTGLMKQLGLSAGQAHGEEASAVQMPGAVPVQSGCRAGRGLRVEAADVGRSLTAGQGRVSQAAGQRAGHVIAQ